MTRDVDEGGMEMSLSFTAGSYVGDDLWVSVLDGKPRQYVDLDTAATSSASVAVTRAVQEFLPWYASVHRGAGIKSQLTSARYEEAREIIVRFVGGDPATHLALFPRNTTEAINLLAYRLRLTKGDVVVTTEVEHHANLLPWARHARLRTVQVDERGTFDVAAIEAALDEYPKPRVLAVSGGSNVTGWLPDLRAIGAACRQRGVLLVVDGAQLVPHRPWTSPRWASTSSPSLDTRCTRPSARVRSWHRRRCWPTVSPSSSVAGRCRRCRSTTSSGPTAPTATTPARRTCWGSSP